MNDEIAVGFFDGHDLEFATALVVSDPTESGLVRVAVGGDGGGGHGDHEVGGLATNPVFAGTPCEPDWFHFHIMSDTTVLCKTQMDRGQQRSPV